LKRRRKMTKQFLNKIFWVFIAILSIITLITLLVAPSEFDKTHNHYVFQELLVKYPNSRLWHNGNEVSKYSTNDKMKTYGVITLETENGTGEVYINETNTRKKIPNTDFYVKLRSG